MTGILVLALRGRDPLMSIISLWKPVSLFGAALTLHSDRAIQPLALSVSVGALCAILLALSRQQGFASRLVFVLLALFSTALLVFWAANPLTMIIGWAIYDLLQAAGILVSGGPARVAVRGVILGSLSTLFLWAGTMLSAEGLDSSLWTLMTPGSTQLALWAMAGALRLSLYPFHLATPSILNPGFGMNAFLLLRPVTGWGLWLRIVSANGGVLPSQPWLLFLAALSLGVGGVVTWSCRRPSSVLSWARIPAAGAVLLAAGLSGDGAIPILSAGSVAWTLSVILLFLGRGVNWDAPWWSVPSLVAALTLLGLPITLGFVSQAVLLEGITGTGQLGWGVAFFVGNLFLIPSLARWILALEPLSSPDQLWLHITRWVSLGLPAALLIVAGFYPPFLLAGLPSLPSMGSLFVMPGLLGWLLWLISLAGGGMLIWQEDNLRPQIELWLTATHDLLCLDWFCDLVISALNRGLSALRIADEVVGGSGTLLWSWLLFLIILLLWGGR